MAIGAQTLHGSLNKAQVFIAVKTPQQLITKVLPSGQTEIGNPQ
jgi:hypothetical protein